MKYFYFISFFIFLLPVLEAQTVEEVMNDKNFIWGRGNGTTLEEANQKALSMIANQISVTVENDFEQIISEGKKQGEYKLEEKVTNLIKTYSNATLRNAKSIIISNEPNASSFLYIHTDSIRSIFNERRNKIYHLLSYAEKAEQEIRIADAIRYYYSALILLKSHPQCNAIEYADEENEKQLAISWIPLQLNHIFRKLNFEVKDIKQERNLKRILLEIHFGEKPVENLDYSYFDGASWNNLYSAKNGEGFVELYGVNAKNRSEVGIKAIMLNECILKADNELRNLMQHIENIPFQESYYQINLQQFESRRSAAREEPVTTTLKSMEIANEHSQVIQKVVDAINSKDYSSADSCFTAEGFKMFQKLVAYGKASIISIPKMRILSYNDQIMCRSLRMSFSFTNNFKKFVEDVVFHFNKEKKIESLSFGLSETALKSIAENEAWEELDRMIIIDFLEHFKTAYALKRLDYIESIFDDQALIITGYVVETQPGLENPYLNNRIIHRNRQTKQQYIKNLKYSFDSKEYINIQFEDTEVSKAGRGENVYGLRVKQNYYSSNYGDTGYLFLIVNLDTPKQPVIHVRTWQPDRGDTTELYSLYDF